MTATLLAPAAHTIDLQLQPGAAPASRVRMPVGARFPRRTAEQQALRAVVWAAPTATVARRPVGARFPRH